MPSEAPVCPVEALREFVEARDACNRERMIRELLDAGLEKYAAALEALRDL
jgi:hypothetical protein